MKKVFQIKLKSLTKVFAVVMALSFVTFTGCKSYDSDIENLNTALNGVVSDVAALKTSVAALQTSVNGMTYIKSIVLGTDGKLTITPSTGTAIVYDAKNYVTYDIKLENNVLTVNGVNKGTVAIPALTFGADNKLMSGSTVVADLSSWVRTLTLSADNYLVINGTKSTILIPPATVQSVDVKGITISGDVLTITKNDGTTSTITLPKTALTLTAVSDNNGGLTLNLNGVDTKVIIKNTYAVDGGYLTVNGVKTTVAIPAENKTSIIFTKDGNGNIISATISDGKDTMVVKLNPSTEPLAGLMFVPRWADDHTWIDGGINAVELGYMESMTTTPAKVLFNESKVTYRFNPTSADVSKTTWKFIHNSARITNVGMAAAPGDGSTLFEIPKYTSNNDGSGTFTLKLATWVNPPDGEDHLFALQATGKDFYSGAVSNVVSDYAKINTVKYIPFISNAKKSIVNTSNGIVNPVTDYRTSKPAIGDANDFDLVADTTGYVYDLDDFVLATAGKDGEILRKTFAAYGFGVVRTDYKFVFSLPTYLGLDGVTNQNSFVTLDEDNVLKVNAGTSVIDRNPLVKVQLQTMTGALLKEAYIKFKIRNKIVAPDQGKTVTYAVPAVNLTYPSLFKDAVAGVSAGDVTDVILTWGDINQHIYNPLGMTHNEFQTKFGGVTPTVAVTVNGTAVAGATLAQYPLIKSMLAPDVDTYAMKYQVTPMAKFGTTVVTYTFDTGVATENKAKISFTYTVAKPTLDKTILAGYRLNGSATDILTQGMNAGSNYLMQLYLGEAFSFGTSAYRNVFGSATANKIDDAKHTFQFKATTPAQTGAQLTPATGGTIDQAFGTSSTPTTGQLMDLTTKLTTAERVYAMQLVTTYPNAETDVFDFNVHFVNPFTIELASPVDFQLIDKVNGTADTQDVKANYIVKFKGKNIVTKGVAETTNSATTVVANDFVDITDAAYGLFYELTPGTSYFTISKAGGNAFNKQSVLTWDNVGTALQTEQTVATTKVKFVASFAEITRTADNVTVKPE